MGGWAFEVEAWLLRLIGCRMQGLRFGIWSLDSSEDTRRYSRQMDREMESKTRVIAGQNWKGLGQCGTKTLLFAGDGTFGLWRWVLRTRGRMQKAKRCLRTCSTSSSVLKLEEYSARVFCGF